MKCRRIPLAKLEQATDIRSQQRCEQMTLFLVLCIKSADVMTLNVQHIATIWTGCKVLDKATTAQVSGVSGMNFAFLFAY